MTSKEFHEYLVQLGEEARDAAYGRAGGPRGLGSALGARRPDTFQMALRERMAQAAQVYGCDTEEPRTELQALLDGLGKDDEPRRQAIARARAWLKERA